MLNLVLEVVYQSTHCNCLHCLNGKEWNVVYPTVTVMHFTDQNCCSKTVYCISCVMVCKIFFGSEFPKKMEKTGNCKKRLAFQVNAKIAFLRASMVVTYYIKFFRTGDERHNGILMSLFLLVVETMSSRYNQSLPALPA